jgi:Uma2 family endonuclease
MQNLKKTPSLSEQEYLETEALAEFRHEYVAGQVYAMAGAGERHNLIALNLAVQMRVATRGGSCRVFINDMKLRVRARQIFYYPDVMLCCDPQDDHELYKEAPCLIAEVLSPSTETTDRREKLAVYQTIASVRYYLLIASNQARVEYYQRADDGECYHAILAANEVLEFECGGRRMAVSLEDFYLDVALP